MEWGLRAPLLRTLLFQSPTRPKTSLASGKATGQNHAQKFPMSFSFHQPVTETDFHPLWNVHFWVSESPSSRSSSLLQDLGCTILSLHVLVQENMCCVTLGHGGVQRGTCPKRVASPYVLQRSRNLQVSIPSHNSAPSTPTNLCLVRQVPAQLHQLCHHLLLMSDLVACSYSKLCGCFFLSRPK